MTIVLGFKSDYLDAEIPNDHVASYVGAHPDRMVGFAGIDPSDPKEATTELHRAKDELSMAGLAIAPAAQDFHPGNSRAMLVYAEAAEQHMPVLFHTGVFISSAAKLEYARPVLLDEVARELPELKFISILATGYNIVDVPAAAERGVVVSNVPEYATDAVAQFTFALLLELCHSAGDHASAVAGGRWAAGVAAGPRPRARPSGQTTMPVASTRPE